MFGFDGAGGFGHEVGAGLGFGERDDVADGLAVEHEHDEAVDAQGDAAVGRGAEAEGIEEEGEFFLGVFGRDAQEAEDFRLYILLVDTDGAAAEFDAVEDDVVGLGVDLGGIGIEQGNIFIPRGGEGMVLGDVALGGGIVIERGEIDDPEEFPLPPPAFGNHVELAGDVLAQFAQDPVGDIEFVGTEEDDIAIGRGGEVAELSLFFFIDELGDGAGHLAGAGVAAEFEVGEALGAELFGFFGEGVEGFAGQRCAAAGDGDEFDMAAGSNDGLEDGGIGGVGPVGDVFEFEAVAEVGPVDAEAVHAFLVGHAEEGGGEFDVEDFFPEADDEAADEFDDIFAIDEGHFEIELGEFGLAIGAEVLIAEAACDLHVAFHAADHEDLFEELGGLREGIEFAGVEA